MNKVMVLVCGGAGTLVILALASDTGAAERMTFLYKRGHRSPLGRKLWAEN